MKLILHMGVLSLLSITLNAQIASWDFSGEGGNQFSFADSKAAGIDSAKVTIEDGLVAFSGSNVEALSSKNQDAASLAEAISLNEYYAIKIYPQVGKLISIDSIMLKPSSQNQERMFVLFSNVNGFEEQNLIDSLKQSGWSSGPRIIETENHQSLTEIELRVYIYTINEPNAYQYVGLGRAEGNDLEIYGTIEQGQTYSLSVTSVNGSTTATPQGPIFNAGSEVALTAFPAEGYKFLEWNGDLSGSQNPDTLLMNEDKSVTAVFELLPPSYSLTLIGEHGTFIKTPDREKYDSSTTVTVEAIADPGYEFNGWSGDLSGNDNPITFDVDSNMTISADFKRGNFIDLSTSFIQVNNESGNSSFTIESNISWSIEDTIDWITISPQSGTGNASISISWNEYSEETSRKGVLTISGESITQKLTISQAGTGMPPIGDYPSVGVGLDGIANYASYSAFNDAVKHAKWLYAGSWNENGYPASSTGGSTVKARMGVDNGDTWPDGEYTLSWEGDGDIILNRPNDAVLVHEDLTSSPKIRVYDCNVDNYGLELEFLSYPVNNVHLFLPGQANNQSLWNPAYLEYIQSFKNGVLRFMDMNGTNGSEQKNWNDRKQRNWSSYTNSFNSESVPYAPKGVVPYEAMMELCNEVEADMYICIPHLATDEYVKNLAHLVKTGIDLATGERTTEPLSPDLRVWIEYSNEVWNWNFAQSNWVNDNLPGNALDDKYAVHAAHLYDIFRTSFNDNDRVVRVIGTQTGWSYGWRTEQRLNAIDRSKYDVLAITSYFNPKVNSKNMLQWAYDNWGATEQEMIDELKTRLGSGPFKEIDACEDAQDRYWHFYFANQFDVPVITYEGGDHINAVNKVDTDNNGASDTPFDQTYPGALDYIHSVVRHPAFHEVTEQWYQRHHESGLTTNIPFVLIGGWSKYGQWGMVEYIGQQPEDAQEFKGTLDYYNLPYPDFIIEEPGIVAVDSVVIVSTIDSIKIGESYHLSRFIYPYNATNKDVVWDSDNLTVAEITNTGEINALNTGLVTISVTTDDGSKKDYLQLKVYDEVTSTRNFDMNDFTFFPNPANNGFVIVMCEDNYNNTIQIFTLEGKEVKHINSESNSVIVNTAQLKNGMYVLSVNGHKKKLLIFNE